MQDIAKEIGTCIRNPYTYRLGLTQLSDYVSLDHLDSGYLIQFL